MQVGFLWHGGTATQSITVAEPGSLQVSFYAAQRDFGGVNVQQIQVSIGTTVVGTFQPTGLAYESFTTEALSLSPGTYALTFAGLVTTGDNRALFDDVQLVFTPAGTVFNAVVDFTVNASTATSANGAWQYGTLPDLSDPASGFSLYSVTTMTWEGTVGLEGYVTPGAATIPLLLSNESSPPATLTFGTLNAPVGFLVLHPGESGQYSALRFVAPVAGTYAVAGTFQGQDKAWTTTDVRVFKCQTPCKTEPVYAF